MSPSNTIRILISYDQQIVAEGIGAVLSKEKRVDICGLKPNKRDQLTNGDLTIDFWILEFCNVSACQMEHIRQIRHANPGLKLLVVTSPLLRSAMVDLMQLVHGLVIRSCSSDKLLTAIYEIEETGKYLSPKAVRALFEENGDGSLVKNDLTSREKEILSAWLTCRDNAEISDRLNISGTTVRTHLKNIREKFGCANQIQMMTYACKENLLPKNFKPICPNCRCYCYSTPN